MSFGKLSVKEFFARSTGTLLRAKLLRALSSLPNGQTPICAVCFSNETNSFTVFNHLPVAERWDRILQHEIQADIYETVVLEAGREKYDDIETGKIFQFSQDWRGGAARFGPVEATEWCNGDKSEVFRISDVKTHSEHHLTETYEFLIEMLIEAAEKKWRLSRITNFPLFLNLAQLEL